MANNKVIYGNTTIMDITDTTAEAADVANGQVFYDRAGVRTVGTGNYMDKVSNPTADDILVTDANGQAVDSGVDIGDVAMAADIPGEATDTVAGTVKLNPNEAVTLNADGQLDVGGRLGAFPGTTGIFHSKDRAPRQVGDFSFLITDAIGMNLKAPRSLALVTGNNITLNASHAAGSTEYRMANNYANRITASGLVGGYLALNEAAAKENQIVAVTSVQIDGQSFTPSSAPNDSSKPIVIKTEATVNPDSAVTQLRSFGSITGGYCSEYLGQQISGASGASFVMGQSVTCATGNMNAVVGQAIYNNGNGNALFGRQMISRKNRWFMSGTGHDNTNGISEAGVALGQWSDIQSDTAFVIGNGTNHVTRSNLFEIKTNGDVYVNGTKLNVP